MGRNSFYTLMFRLLRSILIIAIAGSLGFIIASYLAGKGIRDATAASASAWELLGTPNGGAKEISYSSISIIYVIGENDTEYRCQFVQGNGLCDWREDSSPDEPMDLSECISPWPDIPSPPGEVIDNSEHVFCYGEGKSQTNYAVLTDGSVWRWEHGTSGIGQIAALFTIVGMGTVIGILIGTALAIVLWVRF